MKSKLSILTGVVGVSLVVVAFAFVITSKEPLYGQGRGVSNNPIPDMIGTWELMGDFYVFNDVTDTSDTPVFVQSDPSNPDEINITDQTGRVFAGSSDSGATKVTGVAMPDGSVSIQFFELSELRAFITGTIGLGANSTEITGVLQAFDDFGAIDPADESMGSGLIRAVKQ